MVLGLFSFGCLHTSLLSYSEQLRQMDTEVADAYVNGSVDDAKKALQVYIVRLDKLQRHPDCPNDIETDFARSRGLTEGRLAALHKFLGNTEKANAFSTIALTHIPDTQAKTRDDIYDLVEKMDSGLGLKWKKTELMKIPKEPLEINYTSSSSMKDIEIHERNGIFYQESSYSMLHMAYLFAGLSLVTSLLPLFPAYPFNTLFTIAVALVFLWTMGCCLAVYHIRNKMGQTIVIDPKAGNIQIRKKNKITECAWDSLIGVICRHASGPKEFGKPYQLNLVWHDENQTVQRHCLYQHQCKRSIKHLINDYHDRFKLPLFDHSNP